MSPFRVKADGRGQSIVQQALFLLRNGVQPWKMLRRYTFGLDGGNAVSVGRFEPQAVRTAEYLRIHTGESADSFKFDYALCANMG